MLTVSEQVISFSYAIVSGVLLAFLFDLFRIKRKALGSGRFSLMLEDFLFWVLAGILLILMTFHSFHGEIRGFIYIGVILGICLYLVSLSKTVIRIGVACISLLLAPLRYLLRKFSRIWHRHSEITNEKNTGGQKHEEKKEV